MDSLPQRRSDLRARRAGQTRLLTARAAGVLAAVAGLVLARPVASHAQAPAPMVTRVVVEQEGRTVTDPLVTGLVAAVPGRPLSIRDIRETTFHLMSLGRFEDVRSYAEPASDGVGLRFVLYPAHLVDRVDLRGQLGLSGDDVRAAVASRFGAAPSAARADDIVQALRVFYRDHGYPNASVAVRIEETHDPDRATMAVLVDAGRRAAIARLLFEREDGAAVGPGVEVPGIRTGQPYDADAIAQALQRFEADQRARGYYEARAIHMVEFGGDGSATVVVTVERGPLVSVAFSGDPLPVADRDRLVSIRTEGSVDEDLLEDANRAIEEYLFARGYRDALVSYTRAERDGTLTITFDVRRGRRHVVADVVSTGNTAVASDEILRLVGVGPGEPFVQGSLDVALASVRNAYRARGFSRAAVQGVVSEVDGGQGDADQRVRVALNIVEGPRTLIGEVAFEGSQVFAGDRLRALVMLAPGQPFTETAVIADRDRIDLEYRNLGYDSVVVESSATLVDGDTRANVRFLIVEGPQVLVDHVIVVGNRRISADTIERELLIRSGQPLGYAALIESRARLSALGLFRRVTLEEVRHPGEAGRDILVRVDEAPPTTLDYGGGVEGGTRLRPTGEGGQAEERFELAPRGFFGIGRRNMWGKNRSVNLFTRVSLRARDIVLSEEGERFDRPATGSGYGLNEYRVYGTFREPRVFDTPAEVLLTGIVDRAIRSSFNFITREARGELGLRLSPRYSVAGRYSFEHTRLFDERFTEEEKPLIDRVFPQVRLSKFSVSLIRDTRNDALQPERGLFIVADGDLAARAVGSEVGFVKTYVQAFSYHRLPLQRRIVVALGARVGAAHGFAREVDRLDRDGSPVLDGSGLPIVDVVQDLPASERFFAGGDTTVRGFSLDRLGSRETISEAGFPTGGNGVVVLNAEMRLGVLAALDAVTFVDAGNVFPRAGAIDLTDLRPAAGFGVHYRSPVGPVRVELGFNLDRQELVPGSLERGSVLHISLGQAF